MIEARMRTTGAEAPSDAARTSSGRPHSNRSGDAQQVLLNRGNFEASGDGWPVGNNGSHVLTSTTSATDSGRQGDPAARHVVRQERQRKVACPAKAREAYFFFSLCFTMRTGGPQKDFSIVSSMTPSNGGNGLQHRSASSSSLQGEKERGDRGPAPRRSAADAAPKKNGDQAKGARALRIHGVSNFSACPPSRHCLHSPALNLSATHHTTDLPGREHSHSLAYLLLLCSAFHPSIQDHIPPTS